MVINQNNNKYVGYIYKIENIINNKVYIGQTTQELNARWYQHKNTSINNSNLYMLIHKAMNKYGVDNFYFEEIEKIECNKYELLKTKLNSLEIFYIKKYNSRKPNGYNMTIGGNNVSDYCYKQVNVYDLYGKYIDTYDSIVDGANFLCNGKKDNISACCRGIRTSAQMYIWRFYGDDINKYPLPTMKEVNRILLANKIIQIYQYDYNGRLVNKYDSYKQIDDIFGKNARNCVQRCCNGELLSAYNHIWRFSNNSFDQYNTDIRRKIRYGAINAYTIDEKFLQTFVYIDDIKEFLCIDSKKSISHIYDCISGKRETFYNKKWFKASDPTQPDKSKIVEVS